MTTAMLLQGLTDVLERAGDLVLLRETDLGPSCVDRGDIDLLVAADALPTMLDIIDELTAEHGLHYRLQRSGADKVGVALYSSDMAHSIRMDLWVRLRQILGGRSYLTFEDVAEFTIGTGSPVPRLPADLEAAIYIQHLAIKRRDPSTPASAERLASLRRRCSRHSALAAALDRIQATGQVDELATRTAEQELVGRCGKRLETRARNALWSGAPARAHRRWLERRRLGAVAFVGVDGCGKTSLGEAVAEALGRSVVLAKDAYRRSLVFRGIYKANRLTLGLPYESIDDVLAPLSYVIAAHRLPKIVSDHTVLDRYLGDFLVTDRKSDQPRLSRGARVLAPLYRPCAIVHIRASWSTIESRKKEVSERGHAWYDTAMLHHYRSQPVLDYLVLRNDGALAASAAALTAYLLDQQPLRTRPSP